MVYSEFNLKGSTDKKSNIPVGFACDLCVMPESYKWAQTEEIGGVHRCKFCKNHVAPVFKGEDAFIADLNLAEGERVGITVSGGKDSVYAWYKLAKRLGGDKIVVFCYRKVGLVHPLAKKNIDSAAKILGSEVVIVEDHDALGRFRKNLKAFLEKPTPEMVRVVLCAGCRFGITGRLYAQGYEKYGITKYVSAASYLELAPFKQELMCERGCGNSKYGLILSLADNPSFAFEGNLEIILRDDDLQYKGGISSENETVTTRGRYKLFDLDKYIPNNPELIEATVASELGWRRPERSWHFDCLIEHFKDVFYFGLLGYTETDFKLSAMVRHGLITRDEAIAELAEYRAHLKSSLPETEALMKELGTEELIPAMREFYRTAKYLGGEEA